MQCKKYLCFALCLDILAKIWRWMVAVLNQLLSSIASIVAFEKRHKCPRWGIILKTLIELKAFFAKMLLLSSLMNLNAIPLPKIAYELQGNSQRKTAFFRPAGSMLRTLENSKISKHFDYFRALPVFAQDLHPCEEESFVCFAFIIGSRFDDPIPVSNCYFIVVMLRFNRCLCGSFFQED